MTKDFVNDLTDGLKKQGMNYILITIDPSIKSEDAIEFDGNIDPQFGGLFKYLLAEFFEQLDKDFPDAEEKPTKKQKKKE